MEKYNDNTQTYYFSKINPALLITSKYHLKDLILKKLNIANDTEEPRYNTALQDDMLFSDGFDFGKMQLMPLHHTQFVNAIEKITYLEDVLDLFIVLMQKDNEYQSIFDTQLAGVNTLIAKNQQLSLKIQQNTSKSSTTIDCQGMKLKIEADKKLMQEIKEHQAMVRSKLALIACLNLLANN
ncbi:MAG: hypothetical protein NW207_06665 [Cytophagales bacterium]|nr:hypothetical protein [Cytophagales bacterium]